jgi:antitoxin VapB
MDLAKIFWSGRSQAVRLPKGFRFDTDLVRIRRHGNAVILEPVLKNWAWLDAIRSSSQLDRLERFYGDQGWELSLFAIADLQQADVVQTYTLVYCQDS